MSLGTTKKKTYLNIREGKIIARAPDGKDTPYDYVEGYLGEITTKDREFKGEMVKYWYIDLGDKSGETYSLALPYSSGVAKSIFNSLANITDYSKEIRIKPYISGEFTKVVVYSAGEKIGWKYETLPELEEVKIGERIIKDDTKRMLFFKNIVDQINATL